jgi:hypothetical protein
VFLGELLGARLLLREQLERIEQTTVGHHLVMEVCAGRAAGGAKATNHLAALDVTAGVDGEA